MFISLMVLEIRCPEVSWTGIWQRPQRSEYDMQGPDIPGREFYVTHPRLNPCPILEHRPRMCSHIEEETS